MSEWTKYQTKELVNSKVLSIGDGYRAKNSELSSSGIPFARAGNIDGGFSFSNADFFPVEDLGKVGEKISQPGDVVFTSKGTVGRFAYVKATTQQFVYSPQLCYWRSLDENKIASKYLFYWMQAKEFFEQVEGMKGQTDMADYVSLSDQRQMQISLPEIDEQRQIAEVLSSLDDKIDLLHRQNKTLEQLAETLFVEALKNNVDKWKLQSFSELIETTLGGEWGKEHAEADYSKQVCCIRGTDIADLQIGLAERTPVRFVKEKKFESIQPQNGDLILEISGGTDDQSTGRTIYIDELNRKLFPYPLVFSNFCRLIHPKAKEYSYFLYLYIQYLYKQDEFFNLENGSSGIKNIDYKYLLFELEYLLPKDKKEIHSFNKKVELYFEKINKNKHQIRTLTQLRDTLLPKFMSGEVCVT